jgi:hypothetical protein
MRHHNDNPKSANKAITALFAVFSAIVLRGTIIEDPNSTWVALMGATIITLSLCAILLPARKRDDALNDQ